MTAFRCVWPLTLDGLDMTLSELRADAEADLPDLLWEARAQLTGPLAWRIEGLCLVCEAPAVLWEDPVQHYRSRDWIGATR